MFCGHVTPAQSGEVAHDLLQSVAAMDHRQRARWLQRSYRRSEPACEICTRFDGSQCLAWIRRRIGDRGCQIGWISGDMVEIHQVGRQRPGEVVNDRPYPAFGSIEDGIAV